jgi:hypothetical protein
MRTHLDLHTIEGLDNFASAQGCGKAEAMRYLIEIGLEREAQPQQARSFNIHLDEDVSGDLAGYCYRSNITQAEIINQLIKSLLYPSGQQSITQRMMMIDLMARNLRRRAWHRQNAAMCAAMMNIT